MTAHVEEAFDCLGGAVSGFGGDSVGCVAGARAVSAMAPRRARSSVENEGTTVTDWLALEIADNLTVASRDLLERLRCDVSVTLAI